jgi:phosphomannomutase
MFFGEGFFGFDDALFAAGRLLRYVAATGRSLDELVASLPQYFSTPETRLECPFDGSSLEFLKYSSCKFLHVDLRRFHLLVSGNGKSE